MHVDSVHLLLQFRDGAGANYGQNYWFFGSQSPNSRLTLGSVQPTGVKVSPRIDYDGEKRLEFRSETGVVPKEFSEVADLFYVSVPSGWTTAGRAGIEDPGDWSDL